jgi:hypothetical protein
MTEPMIMKSGTYIVAPELISTLYFIDPFHQSACLHVYSPVVVRQWFGKNVTAATTTHLTTVSRHYPSSCLYLKHNVSETGLCLCLQVEPTQLGSIDRASPYLRTPASTQDRVYKSSTAQTICES